MQYLIYTILGMVFVALIIIVVINVQLKKMDHTKNECPTPDVSKKKQQIFDVCNGSSPSEIKVYSPQDLGLNLKGGAWDAE